LSGYELAEHGQSSLARSGPRRGSTSTLKALPRSVGQYLCDGASPTSSAPDGHSLRSLRSWSRSRCGRAAGLRLREDGRFQLVPVGIPLVTQCRFGSRRNRTSSGTSTGTGRHSSVGSYGRGVRLFWTLRCFYKALSGPSGPLSCPLRESQACVPCCGACQPARAVGLLSGLRVLSCRCCFAADVTSVV
jgi:hypothetical protein